MCKATCASFGIVLVPAVVERLAGAGERQGGDQLDREASLERAPGEGTMVVAGGTFLMCYGMAFADLPQDRDGPTATWMGHIFGRVCQDNGITHKLTRPYHPWTNGQAELMNRTIQDATIKVFHDPDLDSLKAQVLAFVMAYTFGKHLKRLRWRTPFQAMREAWAKNHGPFKINPHHLSPGPHTPLDVVSALRRRTSAGVKERKQQKPDQEAADVRLPGNAAVHDAERRRSHAEQQIRRKPETQEQRRSPVPNEAQKALTRPVVGVVGAMPPWHGGEYEAGRRGHHP
jgi:hypothetical protein